MIDAADVALEDDVDDVAVDDSLVFLFEVEVHSRDVHANEYEDGDATNETIILVTKREADFFVFVFYLCIFFKTYIIII